MTILSDMGLSARFLFLNNTVALDFFLSYLYRCDQEEMCENKFVLFMKFSTIVGFLFNFRSVKINLFYSP